MALCDGRSVLETSEDSSYILCNQGLVGHLRDCTDLRGLCCHSHRFLPSVISEEKQNSRDCPFRSFTIWPQVSPACFRYPIPKTHQSTAVPQGVNVHTMQVPLSLPQHVLSNLLHLSKYFSFFKAQVDCHLCSALLNSPGKEELPNL